MTNLIANKTQLSDVDSLYKKSVVASGVSESLQLIFYFFPLFIFAIKKTS